MKRSTTTTPKERADEFLADIVEVTSGIYGSKEKIRQAMEARTGEPVPRERIERWLHTDPAKRKQPLLGNGLLLREIFDNLTKRKELI